MRVEVLRREGKAGRWRRVGVVEYDGAGAVPFKRGVVLGDWGGRFSRFVLWQLRPYLAANPPQTS
jgi:hypothetical protein